MKNTNKKHSVTRKTAGFFAALALMTATVPTAASIANSAAPAATYTISASAATGDMRMRGPVADYFNENKTEIKDYLLKLANSKIGELAEKVPVAGGLIKSITNKFFSKFITPEEKDMTVKELNENIQQYKKELEDALKKSTTQIENDIKCVDEVGQFYTKFAEFMSMIDDYAEQIQNYSKQNISEEAKTLKIAKLIGNPDEWTKNSGTVFGTYNTSRKLLEKSGLLSKRDIFTAIYDYHAGHSMFAVEAKEKAREAVELIYSQYVYSYAILTECLNAHLEILNIEDTSVLPEMEYKTFSSNIEDVVDRMNMLNTQIFGALEGDPILNENGETVGYENVCATDAFSIEGSYEKFNSIYDFTFINKKTLDQGGKQFSPDLYLSQWKDFDTKQMSTFWKRQNLTEQEILDIVKYANSKGLSIYRFLESIGFKATLPENLKKAKTYIPVSDVIYGKPDISDQGCTWKTKYSIKGVIAFRDAAAENSKDKSFRPTYVHDLTYGTHIEKYDNYYYRKHTDKFESSSWCKDAAIMFLQSL